MDEGYWLYMDDLDWCYRFKQKGWKVCYDGSVTAIHVKGGTRRERKRRTAGCATTSPSIAGWAASTASSTPARTRSFDTVDLPGDRASWPSRLPAARSPAEAWCRSRVDVSAVVVNYQQPDLLLACVASVQAALDAAGVAHELDRGRQRLWRRFARALVAAAHPQVAIVWQMPPTSGFPHRGHDAGSADLRRVGPAPQQRRDDRARRAAPRCSDAAGRTPRRRLAWPRRCASPGDARTDQLGRASASTASASPSTGCSASPSPSSEARAGRGLRRVRRARALFRRAMLDDIGGFDESLLRLPRRRGPRLAGADARLARPLRPAARSSHHHHSATTRHGSPFKYFHVGAQPRADAGQERRHRATCSATAGDRRLRPRLRRLRRAHRPHARAARGRLRGLRQWRRLPSRRATSGGRFPSSPS